MTIEDKILKVADQLAVMSQQRIIGLEKNIADLKIKLKKKPANVVRKLKSRSVAKYSRPEKTGRCGALGAGYCMETTDLLSLSETATSSTAGLVIIIFSSDKIAS
jgi:hypothetical protein